MPKTTTSLSTPLREQLDRLAAFTPTPLPVLSLYLDLRPNEHGRREFDPFLRKAFAERAAALQGDARKSFERDVERINSHLAEQLPKSATAAALFACAAADDFFEAVHLDSRIEHHWLFIGSVPHLYPLARVNDQFPRYAALVVDTNSARVFVFSLGASELVQQVTNVKTRGSMAGGWSQARYQRHLENFHEQHLKEVADVLDRTVREEAIDQIVLACDAVTKPTLIAQLPKHLAEKIVDVVALDAGSPAHEIIRETMDVLRVHDADNDVARVEKLIDAWQGSGLGVVGPDATLYALSLGQVEELLIVAAAGELSHSQSLPMDTAPGAVDIETTAPATGLDPDLVKLADELVTRAQQQSARIRFIEDASLLKDVGGVGAILRFKI